MARSSRTAPPGFLDSVRSSPAAKHLTDQLRGLADAHTSRMSGAIGDKLKSATEALGDTGKTGQLPMLGEGAKRLMRGEGPLASTVGAATSTVAKKASKLLGGGGKSSTKATNIEESIDVGVSASDAYNQWTQFTEFSEFMKGVESVEQVSDTEMNWRVKVFKSRRTWKSKIQEQVPDRRIVWTSEGAKGSTKGVVTFHPLADDLTRVLVTIEYYPSGFMEKTGNLWRAAGRRTRLDLKNFRRHVMMQGQASGAWRGEIHRGQVRRRRDDEHAPRGSRDRRGRDRRSEQSPRSDESRRSHPRARAAGARKTSRRRPSSRPHSDDGAGSRNEDAQDSPTRGSATSAPARKAVAATSTGRAAATEKAAPARKSTARKAPARKSTARKAPARKSAARKAPARKAAPRKATARKAAPRKATARKAAPRKATAAKTTARKAAPRKATGRSR